MTSHYTPPKFGMTSQQLADDVKDFLTSLEFDKSNPVLLANCISRIVGTGDEQYGNEGKFQNFETLSLNELFTYGTEEIEDFVNYIDMLVIRIFRHVEAMSMHLDADAQATWRSVVGAITQLARVSGSVHHDLLTIKQATDVQREMDYQNAIPDSMRPSDDDAEEPKPKESE